MDFALSCVGSLFTVGVAEEQRDITVTPAAHSVRKMAAAPVGAHIMAATAASVHKMAGAPGRAHKMAAKTELRHVTAAIPEPYEVAAVFPEFSQVEAAFPESSQATATVPVSSQVRAAFPKASLVKAVFPASSQVRAVVPVNQVTAIFPEPSTDKMAATPEPLHRMAATPEPIHKMAAVSKPLHKMAAIPEPVVSTRTPPVVMMTHVLDSPLMTVPAHDVGSCSSSCSALEGSCSSSCSALEGFRPAGLPQSPGPPTAPQVCFLVGASGSRSLEGGYVTNLVGVSWSAHRQMSLSPYPHTLTVAPHPGLQLPSPIAPIALPPVANQAHYKAPDFPHTSHGLLLLLSLLLLAFPSSSSLAWLPRFDCSPPAFWTLAPVIGSFSTPCL
ncbi:hypothetical protein M9458_056683 [Cirrhinus mrigala]|uniref:Uncharacterized protein n=1 Tax=Cirrhinus mrigala TaxID=683832 RepID=A0ABD0ME41_CIRMR